MRMVRIAVGIAPLVLSACGASAQTAPEPAGKLVREVVYNELHDHQQHGFWRYWIRKKTAEATQLEEQVETCEGPVTRLVMENGKPLDDDARREEEQRLDRLVNSPSEQADHRRAYQDDEQRITRILTMLPDAFTFQYGREENGNRQLLFHPNPAYTTHTLESRVFHAMTGEIWIDTRMKHLVRLEGRLQDDVNFGFGVLGRLNKGGWFRLDRVQVNGSDWKTQRLEVHMTGRAILFKTIGRETSEVRGGFAAVPPNLDLKQAMDVLHQTGVLSQVEPAHVTPVSYPQHR